MSEHAPIILLTRPIAQSEAFRALLPPALDVVISPVVEIRQIKFSADIEHYAALVFASANGVRAAAQCLELSGVRAICVGKKTARVARDHGMSAVSGAGGAQGLVAVAVRENLPGKLLFVRGRHSAGDVEGGLKLAGIDTDVVVVYGQAAVPLSQDAVAVLRGPRPVVVPLFSPRSAALLSAEMRRLKVSAPICLVAMSHNILAAWDGPRAEKSSVACGLTAPAMVKETMQQVAGWAWDPGAG